MPPVLRWALGRGRRTKVSMLYLINLKIHILLAITTIVLFQYRFWRRTRNPFKPVWHPMKWIPHTVDTFLMLTGLINSFITWQIPFYNSTWLSTKILLLLAYIGFGFMAMKSPARSFKSYYGYVFATVSVALIVYMARYKPMVL